MKQQLENRKYYEAYDERYKQIHYMNLEWEANVHSPIIDEIIAKLKLNHQSKILELGCGEGRDAIDSIAVLHMLVLEEHRNKFLAFVREHLNENGYGLILTMGDGEMERSSDISNAFDKQERVHVETGTKVCIASTSCKIVSFTTLEREIEENGLSIVEKGITAIEPGFPMIMYAIVKKK